MKTNNLYAQLSVGQGPAGPVGPQGPKGDKGDKGETGPVGPQGPKGDKGERGARGERGLTGPTGLQGERGAQGPEGQRGPQGIQGPKGDKGDKGDIGEKGERGEKGEKGDSGGVMSSDMVDYVGNQHKSLKAKNDADVEWLLGKINGVQEEINTVHYEGQHITATDTIEGQAKSAILKGQTLVNISIVKEYSFSPTQIQVKCYNNEMVKTNTEYTVIYDITETNDLGSVMLDIFGNTPLPITLGSHKVKLTSIKSLKNKSNMYISGGFTGVVDNIMIIEGDYTNVDIPYFEGMASCKMPVLTTTGKNLFDEKLENNRDIDANTGAVIKGGRTIPRNFIPVEPNTSYTLTRPVAKDNLGIRYYSKSQDYLSLQALPGYNGKFSATFSTPSDCYFIKFIDEANTLEKGYQIEQGPTATSYEPYKTNILSCNEEVALRGIGDVKDELNLLTGELAECIGEVVLDGSEDWVKQHYTTGYTMFRYNVPNLPTDTSIRIGGMLCDKFNVENYINTQAQTREFITLRNGTTGQLLLNVSNEKANEVAVLKEWLSQNPITVQYKLATPTIKTVDLSSNHVYSYNDTTYYDCSSAESSLVPTLSINVSTKLNALVARQKDTIQELAQENESLKAAQQILLNAQLSFYESLVSAIPALMPVEGGQAIIPDFIQDLYRLEKNQK